MPNQSFLLHNPNDFRLNLVPWDRIFLYGDLWSGKTAIAQAMIKSYLSNQSLSITSPTYTYYKKYQNIYHFDLYRLPDYDTFVQIGGEEILDDTENICLIEWPEILEGKCQPTKTVRLFITTDENIRQVEID